jgi:pimeloyl-ACP methyl ester carboxylesterase
LTEAFRQGGRGQVQDHAIEGRPWRIPLEQIRVPVTIWCGDDDRIVDPRQSQFLAAAIPSAHARAVEGAGHFLLADHATQVLISAVEGEPLPRDSDPPLLDRRGSRSERGR